MKKDTGRCDCEYIHEDAVKKVSAHMSEETLLYELADFFKVFGDATRIRILWALSKSELCVCDLSAVLEMKQSAISHQLRLLKQAKLVRARREGKIVYYTLSDEHVQRIFEQGLTHIKE